MECEICQQKFNESKFKPMVLMPCCHTYCSQCLKNWKEKTCPSCRVFIQDSNINWSLLKLVPTEDPIELELRTIVDEQFEITENFQKEFDKIFSIKSNEIRKVRSNLTNRLNHNYISILKQSSGPERIALKKKRNSQASALVQMEIQLNEKLNAIRPTSLNFALVRNQIDEDFYEARLNLLQSLKEKLEQQYSELVLKIKEIKAIDIDKMEKPCEKLINKIMLNQF